LVWSAPDYGRFHTNPLGLEDWKADGSRRGARQRLRTLGLLYLDVPVRVGDAELEREPGLAEVSESLAELGGDAGSEPRVDD
jgi:hypothetical protein